LECEVVIVNIVNDSEFHSDEQDEKKLGSWDVILDPSGRFRAGQTRQRGATKLPWFPIFWLAHSMCDDDAISSLQ
jgi:hypothetical protein